MDRTSNKVDAVRLYASYRLNLLLLDFASSLGYEAWIWLQVWGTRPGFGFKSEGNGTAEVGADI